MAIPRNLSNLAPGASSSGVLDTAHGGTGTSTTFTSGSLPFANSSGIYTQDNANLSYDSVNNLFFAKSIKSNQATNPNNTLTVTSNAATVPITYKLNTFTNSSAATMTITLSTSGAVDGQQVIIRIYDFSSAAQTITWVNTENSSVVAPTTSNGSITLPLTVGFMYNAATGKWRCLAYA